MKILIFCLISLLSFFTTVSAFELTILHTNDVHATLAGIHENGSFCYEAQCKEIASKGGAIRLQNAINNQRMLKKNTLLLDAGDQATGTLFYKIFSTEPSAKVMNKLKYDAIAPGNHEFDAGCEGFQVFTEQLDAPFLVANIEYSKDYTPIPDYKPWVIIEKEGRKIGIIGLITPLTATFSRPCSQVVFNDPIESARKAVKELEDKGVNIIIALVHLGYNVEKNLAKKVSGLDIIVGGHSHTLLSNLRPEAKGAYPTIMISPTQEPVLLVTTQGHGYDLGVLDISFDASGKVIKWQGEPVALNNKLSEEADLELMTLIQYYTEPLQDLLTQNIGEVKTTSLSKDKPLDIGYGLCRKQECITANFFTDALLWSAKKEGAQIAFINGGVVRISLQTGEISVGDILSIMPYDNVVVMADISGRLLKDSLEQGLRYYEQVSGSLLQVAGMRYAADINLPAGKRLISAEILMPNGSWEIVQNFNMYKVVTIDYLARGGGNFAMLKDISWQSSKKIHSDILQEYVRAISVLKPTIERRITLH